MIRVINALTSTGLSLAYVACAYVIVGIAAIFVIETFEAWIFSRYETEIEIVSSYAPCTDFNDI